MTLSNGRERLEVWFQSGLSSRRRVGTLGLVRNRLFFEYTSEWCRRGLELSPFLLPLSLGTSPVEHTKLSFGPLFGLFDDSLPDGWGLLLMERYFASQGVAPERLNVLDRLAFLGSRTMGALTYHPPTTDDEQADKFLDLARLAEQSTEILQGTATDLLPELLRAGGSPGGARPKVLVGYSEDSDQLLSGEEDLPNEYEHWIVKFHGTGDPKQSGPLELAYADMARAAGLAMPRTRLFESRNGQRFFGVKRFDRGPGSSRIHAHTFGNLIQANFRVPCCDYEALLKATLLLTRDRRCLLAAFRQCVFNVLAHNRDDHVKNFAFLLDDQEGTWRLAPAYDLTFSSGPGGEHTTTICGEGRNPSRAHLMELAKRMDIQASEANPIVDEVQGAVSSWSSFARAASVSVDAAAHVGKELGSIA